MTTIASEPTETAAPTAWWGPALAGVVAAGVALAVGELVASLAGIKSLVLAVGDVIVEHAPAWLASEAIGTLGDKNKPTLIVGIVVVCLVLGAVLGMITQRRRIAAPLGFTGFAALGVWAQSSAEGGDVGLGLLAAWMAAVAGTVSLQFLLTRWNRPPAPASTRGGHDDPRRPRADRRAFLGWSGGMAAAAAVLASGSRSLGSRSRATEARDELAARLQAQGGSAATPTGLETTVDGLTPLVQPNDRFYKIDTTLFSPRSIRTAGPCASTAWWTDRSSSPSTSSIPATWSSDPSRSPASRTRWAATWWATPSGRASR